MSASKSFSNETSERYARALFEVAKDSSEIEKIERSLQDFLTLQNSSIEIENFIKNPTQTAEIQKNVIDIISKKMNFCKNLKNFLFLLIEKKRIFFLKRITQNFLKLCASNRGEVKALMVSSKELTENELENLSSELSKSMGSIIKFEYSVDKSLIGGLKLQLGSTMIDTSLKNKLRKYKQLMIEN